MLMKEEVYHVSVLLNSKPSKSHSHGTSDLGSYDLGSYDSHDTISNLPNPYIKSDTVVLDKQRNKRTSLTTKERLEKMKAGTVTVDIL